METLTLEMARQIVDEALASARRQCLRPMALVVIDEGGNVKYVVREDGATALRIDIAHGKAAAAFGMGVASRALAERAAANPVFYSAIGPAASGPFVPQTGAVLIVSQEGVVLGAIGASGGTGDEDEVACIEGIRAADLAYR